MPTGSKLAAALCLGILAVIVSEMVKPLMPESTVFGYFTFVSFLLGAIVGWRYLGRRAGAGTVNAINNGITGVVILVFFALFVYGSYEMLDQSLRHRYREPMEALRGILEIGMGYGLYLLNVSVIATLCVGAVLSGLITEYAYRHWR